MPHIVTDNCRKCRFTECVSVCPVECFHADDEMIYIDPDGCIDCGGCIPVCPVSAIYDTLNMPDEFEPWIAVNAERAPQLPVVFSKQPPLDGAERRRDELGFGS